IPVAAACGSTGSTGVVVLPASVRQPSPAHAATNSAICVARASNSVVRACIGSVQLSGRGARDQLDEQFEPLEQLSEDQRFVVHAALSTTRPSCALVRSEERRVGKE